MPKSRGFFPVAFISLLLIFSSFPILAGQYDLVIQGGRVMDPETQMDAVMNVGIKDGRIAAIAAYDLPAAKTQDATGLVVSPGFIDLHAHGQNTVAQTYQVRDGVTSALELEGGVYEISKLLVERDGSSLINYGYSAGYGYIRAIVKEGDQKRSFHEVATPEELDEIVSCYQ